MGYRELLKRYMRFLEVELGDNFIEVIPGARESGLTDRDVGELRTLAGEIFREQGGGRARAEIDNFNYRLRLLMNRHGLTVERVAALSDTNPARARSWRTSPKSTSYQEMTGAEFDTFERALTAWLESESNSARRIG